MKKENQTSLIKDNKVEKKELKKVIKESGIKISGKALSKFENNLQNVIDKALSDIGRILKVANRKTATPNDIDMVFLIRERGKAKPPKPKEEKKEAPKEEPIKKEELIKEIEDRLMGRFEKMLKVAIPQPATTEAPKEDPQKETKITGIKEITKSGAVSLMKVKIVGIGNKKELPDKQISQSFTVRDESLGEKDSGAWLDLIGEDIKKYGEKGKELKLKWCYAKKRGANIWLKKGTNGEVEKIE